MVHIADDPVFESALNSIKVSDCTREEWINVGMACHHKGLPVSVWVEWSKNDSRFIPGECEEKYMGFHNDGAPNRITAGTVIKLAEDKGWIRPNNKNTALNWDSEIQFDLNDNQAPIHLDLPPAEELKLYLNTLYDPDDIIRYVTQDVRFNDKKGKWDPLKGTYVRTAYDVIQALDKHPDRINWAVGDWKEEVGAWIGINPLDGQGVENKNVAKYKHVLIEFDNLPLDEQEQAYRKLQLPIAAMVSSGGKSIHAIIKVDASNLEEYKKRVQLLYSYLEKHNFHVDPNNKNVARLSRMPGVTRNGNRQQLLAVNIGKASWNEWLNSIHDPTGQGDESPFDFYTVSSLTPEERRPPDFIVEKMVPVGLTFIAGAPKIRKSFFALLLAACVATGHDFLMRKTIKSDVVYLDLEGSKSRISTRTERMSIPIPDNVLITNIAKNKLANGQLVEDIRNLSKKNPSLRLVIIDTYSRARGGYKSQGANAYDADVQLLEPLQRMAIEQNIAVVCVHHEKKGASLMADSFERLNGTMGISGSADCVMNLVADGERFEGRASLEFTPRDCQGGKLDLVFDEVCCEWCLSTGNHSILNGEIPQWIINNPPEKGKSAVFYSYQEIANYLDLSKERAGEKIRTILEPCIIDLSNSYKIAVQLGAQSHGQRGIRIMSLG